MENTAIFIQNALIYAIPVLFAITMHEAAHALAAKHFGDPLAWNLGRVSANPLRHIDPVGTIAVPMLTLLASGAGILFGWAKPVPVRFGHLRNPRSDTIWVAAAGPGANFLMAFIWAFMFKLALVLPAFTFTKPLLEMSRAGILVNLSLMLLNLLPILPLDGGRILHSLLPPRAAMQYGLSERFGIIVLLLLLASGLLGKVLIPMINVFVSIISAVLAI